MRKPNDARLEKEEMKICVHTATVQLDKHNKIIAASLEKGDVMKAAQEFKQKYPGLRVRIESVLEEVER